MGRVKPQTLKPLNPLTCTSYPSLGHGVERSTSASNVANGLSVLQDSSEVGSNKSDIYRYKPPSQLIKELPRILRILPSTLNP